MSEMKANLKKATAVLILVVLMLAAFSMLLGHSARAQTSQAQILSYSWYASPSDGDFIVVGEIQNIGNSVLSSVSLNAVVYASGGTELASASTTAFVSYLLPQQKAPFYIDFGSPGTDTSSTYSTVSNVKFTITNAPTTVEQPYESLSLNTGFVGALDGAYTIMGLLSNTGNQTASGIRVVGTYYNSVGTVVAVGFNNVTGSLTPNNSATFTVSEFDATPRMVSQISNYSLLVQTQTLQNNNSPSSASTSAPSSGSAGLTYGVVGAVMIVVVAVTALVFLRKRRNRLPTPPPPPPPE